MSLVERADILRGFFMKARLLRDSLACGRPHIGDIDVLLTVVIEIGPACAHSGSRTVDAGFGRDSRECAVAIVPVQVTAPEIVSHAEIGQVVARVVAPGAGETIAVVLCIQSCRFGSVYKRGVAFVMQEEICRAIPGIEIGHWIVILVEAKIVGIEAEVDIETSVAIVVGYSRMRERSLGRTVKPESIALGREGAVALIQKEQGAASANDKKILAPLVLEIGKQGAGGIVEY